MNCTLCALISIVSEYADCFSIHLLLTVLEEEIFFFNVIMNWLNLDDILYLYHVDVMLIVI